MAFSIKAMWNNKCPRCRQGNIFKEPLDFGKPLEMETTCNYCGQKTEPEPGFYYGAMFLSFGIECLVFLPGVLIAVLVYGWSIFGAMSIMLFLFAVSFLKILRGSRSLWLHMIVKHRPDIESKIRATIIK